jgi:hypothetical protein
MIHIFVNNFFCVACIIFALTIFNGNDLLYNLIVCKCLTIINYSFRYSTIFQEMFTRLPVLNGNFLFKFCFILDFKC